MARSAEYDEEEMSNSNISRTLLVILLIHVLAVGGIFFHRYRIEGQNESSAMTSPTKIPVAIPVRQSAPDPDIKKISDNEMVYTVGSGDTYAGIAKRFGVTEMALREKNDSIHLRQGRKLKIPAQKKAAEGGAAVPAVSTGTPPAAAPSKPEAPATDRLVVTEAAKAADAGRLQTPAPAVPPRAELVEPAPALASPAQAGAAYVVKKGDTFWGIAKRHGTTPEKLMSANNIKDPKKLRPGMTLRIPR